MRKLKRSAAPGSRVLHNTVMLYILTFSNYLFNFLTVPYQTRVLGPAIYGNLGFALSFMTYFQLVMDFGFILSGTEEVSLYREDKRRLSTIFSGIMISKLILVAISGVVLAVLCMTVERFKTDILLYVLYFLATAAYAFLPDFLYRGMEQMTSITVRSVLIKLFFTLMIFVVLREPSQYYAVPVLTMIGNILAVLGTYVHMYKINVRFVRVGFSEVWRLFKRSSFFFYSRIASTIYSATNVFILGLIYGNSSPIVGYYTSTDKIITTGKQAVNPIGDSLYPYMVKNKNFKLIKKILLIGMPVLTAGCIFVALFAPTICAVVFGEAFRGAGLYLRLMVPVVFLSFPAVLFGFPVLSPIGLAKYANWSNIFGAVLQILSLLILYAIGQFNAVGICIVTCVTEFATLAFRLLVCWRNRGLYAEASMARENGLE